jgi:hypothetical protein
MAEEKSTPALEPKWVDKGDGELVLENSPPPKPRSLKDLRKDLQEQWGLKPPSQA